MADNRLTVSKEHFVRRPLQMHEIIAVTMFLINLSALVWGASAINSTVKNLESSVDKLTRTTDNLVPTVAVLQQQVQDIRVLRRGQ